MSRNNEFDLGLPPDPLAEGEQKVLQFAQQSAGRYVADEESLATLGIPSETFYRKVSRLLSDPAAEAHDPQTIQLLRQTRDNGIMSMFNEQPQ